MGKFMKKAKMAGDVAVMDVSQPPLGVCTRARTLAARQKGSSSPASGASCYLQLRSRRLLKHVVPGKSRDDRCSDARLVRSGPSPALVGSCAVEDGLEGDDGRERSVRGTTPSNLVRGSEALGTLGSTNRPMSSAGTIAQTRSASRRSIPTTHEMEEFFAGAERQQVIIFTEKYNYDPVKDLPLPGRYEWGRLN